MCTGFAFVLFINFVDYGVRWCQSALMGEAVMASASLALWIGTYLRYFPEWLLDLAELNRFSRNLPTGLN